MQNGDNSAISVLPGLIGRRVDLFITELYVGGAEKCLTDLALFLKKQGAAVRVLSLASLPTPPDDSLLRRLREAEIEVHALGANRIWNAGSAIIKLRKHLQDAPPDILQSFLFHANMISAAAILGLRVGHDTQTVCRLRWVAGVRVADPRQQRLALESLAFRRADRVVAVSEGARLVYRKYSPIQSDKWLVIPNGIETRPTENAAANWQSLGLPTGAKVILFVGRLDVQKGVAWLLETASDWLAQLPEHHLVIAGRGSLQAQLDQQLESLRHTQPQISGRVHLVGWLEQPRVWMSQAEMLVLPAKYEGMPNVCLEAMAEGIPVVAFDVQGIQELLGGLDEGQVVPAYARDGWRDAIVEIATNKELKAQLAHRNRQRIAEDYQLEKQLQKYVELYRQLV